MGNLVSWQRHQSGLSCNAAKTRIPKNGSINLQAPISLITPEVRDILASTGYFLVKQNVGQNNLHSRHDVRTSIIMPPIS